MTAKPQITLISPNKIPFIAQWVGDDRAVSKKLGIFEMPLVKGAVVQDLDVGGDRYPLTFYFTGAASSLSARLFWSEIKENGRWIIIHPVLGSLTLQPITISDAVRPVEDVHRRVFTTEWIEPIPEGFLSSLTFLLAVLDAATFVADASAADAFISNIRQATFGEIQALTNAVGLVITSVKKILSITDRSSPIPAELLKIESSIDALLIESPIDGASLAASLQRYVRLPSLGMTSVEEGYEQYNSLLAANTETSPGTADNEGLNEVAVQEIALTSCTTSLASMAAISGLTTRAEAISFAEQMKAAFDAITNALDSSQALFVEVEIDNQYFSQSQSYNDSALLTAQAMQYLLTASLDLQTEKRIILTREKSPLRITVDEYGTLGENDANYHLFVDSNKLKKDEILILPAGKEVVIYV